LKPYESPDGRLGDALSGSVYRDAYQRIVMILACTVR